MEVLKICVVQGVQTFNLNLPIVAEELKHHSSNHKAAWPMANYFEVANLDQLPPGTGTVVLMEGKDIALFNVGETVYAMDDACLHHEVSLRTSELDGKIITCRGHGWKYDVTTGSTQSVKGFGVAANAGKLDDGKIMVAIDEILNQLLDEGSAVP